MPVKAGPFDLGTVVTRAAIQINRKTATLRVVSDPLPMILDGIPLQVQAVHAVIDRERFMLNPTSCRTTQIVGTIGSTTGSVARVASRFRVADCAQLGTVFNAIPDVPITRFTMRFEVGRNGPLGVAENLCTPAARRATAKVSFVGHNGKSRTINRRLSIAGCSRKGRR